MASGMGAQGGVSRSCLDESKGITTQQKNAECAEWLEDYNECLHHGKAHMRQFLMEREAKRQEQAKAESGGQ
ncbi:NADH:ubiquinone oxidoreductase 15 kDa subunit-like precursor [Dunaliella salina]|uniref:NADH:ubiquinone oxidoreductase 15 kDa subunit-like n=1 Tax=Dunaliella salina TaxID=3046 RepID=A0ABQ7GUB3_DUNSA|nr:NADH:ubiquinone oxidoreductase 15 kDa subunit-like precursor [Dunaliella salina]|eukprot:KAF5838210.1 NADH:ubiquinone oxidoreductase 15 kDa subunit-like precursor [Dunaliella salina]